ncbi:TetR/AcrR family transcriptional regulator [Candidatus Parcubacteria bacterium]|nr:MAG: TetR/AcrR family transcriptional regulator [Candidatus Parcubacteria bacterium]
MCPRTHQQLTRLRAERKAQIIQAALEVFVQKGYHAANISDVATKAGVSQGTIYHYFPSKDALFLAAYETWEVQSLYGEIQQALDDSQSPAEQLRLLAQTVADRMTQAAAMLPANVEFWSHISRNEAVRDGFRHLFQAMRKRLAVIIQEGVARGEFVAVDAEETATLLIAVYDGLILQWLAEPRSVNWADISQTLSQVFLHGLLKPSGEA